MSNPAITLYKALHKKRSYTKLYWDVANVVGISEALLIEIVERWCEINEDKGRTIYFHDLEWWTSASYKQWAEMYPALGSDRSIQRLFLKLKNDNYILSCQPLLKQGNPTKFYRVNADVVGTLLLEGKSTGGLVPNLDEGLVPFSDQGLVPKTDQVSAKNGHSSICRSDLLNRSESPLPPVEKKQEPALGDYGSKEPTPPTLEEEVVSSHQSQVVESDSMDVNPGESKKVPFARDNKAKRIPEGDAFFGQKSQERRQRSFAAKVQRTIIPIEEMEPWEGTDVFQAFEAYLLAEAKKWNCQNPASYVAKKLQDIASGKAPRTEFNEWQAARQTKPETSKQQLNLTPAEEAWIAIVSQIELVEDGAWARVTQQNGAWIVTSNINGFSGKLGEVMLAIPLESVPASFTHWYPECYRRATKKFPNLTFPEPVAPINRAS